MGKARNAALIGVLGLAPSACGESGAGASASPASTVRDSAGITIVENDRPTESHQVGWTIGSTPDVSIGTLDGDERYQLFRVVDALVLSDGRIAVANRGTSEIRVYDADGQHRDSWGGEGEGPGEFTGLSTMWQWRGDSLLAWDSRVRRATVFDGEGTLGRTFPLNSDDRVATSDLVGVLPDGRLLTRGSFIFTDGDSPSGLQRADRPYSLAGPEGDIEASLGDHVGAETYALVSPQMVMVTSHPFARRTIEAVWGGAILLSASDRYELNTFDTTGALVRSVWREHNLQVVTEQHMSTFVESRVDRADETRRPQILQQYEDMPLVETFPAFDEVQVDGLDHLWVRDYVPPPEEGQRWTVFDPDGRVMGWIETPPGFRVMEIGEAYVLGVATDDFDVEHVQRWRLDRTERAP